MNAPAPTKEPNPKTVKSGSNLIRTFRRQARGLTPFLTLIVLVVFFAVFSEGNRFMLPDNLRNILQQAASLAVLATGITYVLLIGEIDLSIGGVATAAGVVSSYLLVSLNFPDWACILIGILVGVVCGLVNGLVIAKTGVPSFMTTLAMGIITTGIALFLTKGRPIFEVPEFAAFLGTGEIGPIPVIVLVAIVVMFIGWFVARFTRFGRYIYMVGGSREAAELSGVNSKNVVIQVMLISGLLAGIAGVVGTGRLGSANPDIFKDSTMDAIAAVVLGGTSLFGGVGSVASSVIGLLVFGVLKNGLNMVNVDIYLKGFITGVILLLALLLNVYALRIGQAEQEAAVEETAAKEQESSPG
jgi:ribose transport system permease protein